MSIKTKISLLSSILLFICTATFAEKVIVPIVDNGAYTLNTQPASVYNSGKVFFTWINKSGNLVVSSYDQTTDEVKTATVASGYATEDLSSPAILIRASGQILIFASKNGQETNMQCYYSSSVTGDITQGFTVSNLTGYGISATLPFAMGDNIVLFWRSKNNLGYTFFAGENAAGKTNVLAAGGTTRTGFLGDPGFGNNYDQRDEVPVMRAVQDGDGNIHIAITQLGTGLKFSNSTIHYLKAVNNNNTNLKFYKASGSDAGTITYATPPDVVYATTQATDKAIAYDIKLMDGKPAILYDAFNGNNVNATTNPGVTSNHTYKIALWDGTQWVNNTIAEVGDGLPIEQYTAVGGKTFKANSYQVGGICFDANNSTVVYLSKKESGGTFELYKYETEDAGENWQQVEAITSNTPSGEVNIRPIQVINSPTPHVVDLLWMRGVYSSPKTFNTSIMSRGEVMPVTSIVFEASKYYLVENEIIEPKLKFSPLFVLNREVMLESSNPDVAVITADGKVKGAGVGSAIITAKAVSDNTITATCEVVVEQRSVFDIFMDRMVTEAFADRISSSSQLDSDVTSYLALLQTDGSFPDVDYASTDRTNWAPLVHLDRMLKMGLAYTYSGSSYYQSTALKTQLDLMLSYWQSKAPKSNNWYQNEIGEPQRMGLYLVLIQYLGAEKIPTTLFNNAITRLKDKGGDPGAQAGANRVDVALHWVYRACLTADRELLQTAINYIYSPIEYTTGSEGIQYDNSYTQHGRQLHIGSYGEVFLDGETKTASYAAGTLYSVPSDKLDILSKLVKDTYLSTLRADNISYNVIGRASTRPGATIKGKSKIIERMISIDAANASVYIAANERLAKTQSESYKITPSSTHYYKTDYTLHKRPNFMVDLRMVSTRTARNEYLSDNLEGKKQYFLSDGSTGIFVKGNEYADIFPVWNWAKIPGVTCPEFTTIPQASTYIKAGQSDFVGGVSDSIYSVSTYKYSDNEFNINSSANKSWFFFDKEIVCLGSNIKSTANFKVNTTLNQCLRSTNTTVSVNQTQQTLEDGNYSYNNTLEWVYQGGVGYYFPKQGNVDLSIGQQTGNWFDINGNYSSDIVSKEVFTLSFNHGMQPNGGEYAYIIVPGLADQTEAQNYNSSNIEILANTDSLQAVYNNESGVLGLVFYRSCGIKAKGVTVEAEAPCVVMIKDINKANTVVYVSDPQNGSNPIKLGISTPMVPKARLITYQATAPYQGNSLKFLINDNLPIYAGKDVLLNRSDWTIVCSSVGPVDATVATEGDVPGYIIDGDTKSSFLFVKPGKSYGGVTVASGEKPWFMIDLKKACDMTYLVYRHRDYNNTTTSLRASKGSFYGKNTEGEEFQPIIENFDIATNSAEVRIDFPEKVSYRYVKFVMEVWDETSGNTIQVSEFNLGCGSTADLGTGLVNPNTVVNGTQASLYPNPIKAGKPFYIRLNDEFTEASIVIYTLAGVKILECKAKGDATGLIINRQGVYVIEMKKNNKTAILKAVIK